MAHKVLQWYLCRMEGWFAADTDTISLKCWDKVAFAFEFSCFRWFKVSSNASFVLLGVQEVLLPGGHGLMVRGYQPVINTLAKGLDIYLGHR